MAVPSDLHLPSLASELVSAQTQQTHNLKESLAALKETNTLISEAEQRNKAQQLKLFAIEKDIYTLRNDSSRVSATTEKLKQAISTAIEEKCKLNHETAQMQLRQQKLRSELLRSRKKMATFISSAHANEQGKPAFKETENARKTVTELRAKCRQLSQQQLITIVGSDSSQDAGNSSSGSKTMNRRAHLEEIRDDLEQRHHDAKDRVRLLQEKISGEKKREQGVAQAIQLVKKRQAAQLTRLRRQVQDAQQKNHRWQSVASQYRQQIAALRRELRQSNS